MLEKHRNLYTWKTRVHKEICLTKRERAAISSWLSPCIENHFSVQQLPHGFVEKSFRDMKWAQLILFDPYHWKNKLLGSMVSSFSHQPLDKNIDYLNTKQREWKHSATNVPSNLSFEKLYNDALQEASSLFEMILEYWNPYGTVNLKQVSTLLDHISYDTGLPLSRNLDNLYSEPII